MRKPREQPEPMLSIAIGSRLRVVKVDRRNYALVVRKATRWGVGGYYPSLDSALDVAVRRNLELHLDAAQVVEIGELRIAIAGYVERALEEVERARFEFLADAFEVDAEAED